MTGGQGARTVSGMAVRGRMIGGLTAAVVAAGLLTASATATPAESQPIGHYSTPDMAATYPVPLPAEGDVICTGQSVGPYLGEMIAWQEIGELRNLGLPVCDVAWQFGDIADDTWWGWSESTDTGTVITIEVDLTEYAAEPDPDLAIRSIVRHEFGHALAYAAGYVYGSGDLDATFADTLSWTDEFIDRGHEAAAEAVSEILADMRADDRRPAYVDHPTEASMTAAAAIIAAT